jgi:hypothetical protein
MQNNFKLLITALIILAVISYFVLQNNHANNTSEAQLLVPELGNLINEVDGIEIKKNDKSIHLSKSDGIWRIAEADGYMADTNKIANLLLGLRKFTLKEKKTNNPDNYHRLDLAETGENAAAIIKLKNADSQFADISIGKQAQRSQGTYVRKNDDPQTWLSQGEINLDMDSSNWIVTSILDIESHNIKSVSFSPSESVAFNINKLTPDDQNFVLDNIPQGMQIKADTDINSLASGLQKLSIDSVLKIMDTIDVPKVNTITYQLFSGMTYQLDLYNEGDQYMLTVELKNITDDTQFDKQLENWLFVMPKYKFEALNKSLDQLIETKSEVSTETSDDTAKK